MTYEDHAAIACPGNHWLPREHLRVEIKSWLSLKNDCLAASKIARFNEEMIDIRGQVKSHVDDLLSVGRPRHWPESIFSIGINNLLRFRPVRARGPDFASQSVPTVQIEPAKATSTRSISNESNPRAIR